LKILNNEEHIFRVKVPLVKGANNNLTLSIDKVQWAKLGWKEGTMLEIRQDNKDNKLELTIRQASVSMRDRLGIKK
tara:strand:- start:4 stop:231 length:228 start_codon:yes stop_codon:yes gene_type:complete